MENTAALEAIEDLSWGTLIDDSSCVISSAMWTRLDERKTCGIHIPCMRPRE